MSSDEKIAVTIPDGEKKKGQVTRKRMNRTTNEQANLEAPYMSICQLSFCLQILI